MYRPKDKLDFLDIRYNKHEDRYRDRPWRARSMGDGIEEDEEPEGDRRGSSDIWRQCQEEIGLQNPEAQESGTQGTRQETSLQTTQQEK